MAHLSRLYPILAVTCTLTLPRLAWADDPPPAADPNAPPAAPAPKTPRANLLPSEPARVMLPTGDATKPLTVDPAKDEQKLAAQGAERPRLDPSVGAAPSMVYSEEWWSHTRPVLELHGYFRTRGELLHNFFLGRRDDPGTAPYLYPQPLDNSYSTLTNNGSRSVNLCGNADGNGKYEQCADKSQASANMRLRLNPELHISDNLRVMAQIDALDNLVLGSTPDSYATGGALKGNANARDSIESQSQGAPTAGVNGTRNSIDVKRAWAEYLTPVGQLRFGRMPFHWGLGMLYNAGDGVDQDYQTNVDRIQFVSGIRSLDLYFGGSWDFVSTGPTDANAYSVYGGQPVNTSNRANVGQWQLFAARRTNPEVQRLSLSRGDIVINGGALGTLRTQELDLPTGKTVDITTANFNYERRGATLVTPDLWVQFLWRKLRIEAEAAMVVGSVDQTSVSTDPKNKVDVLMAGGALEADFRAIDDKLRIAFGTGYSSGDPGVLTLNPGNNRLTHGQGKISMFRFNPAYNVDLILHRRILQRVQGTYYFRPSVDYDFIRNPTGQKFGGSAAIIWTRASEFVQTPGHARDLGVELNLSLYYQAKDGSLNDDPTKMGGFYAMLQYGVLFPLSGFDYSPQEKAQANNQNVDTSSAQTVRLHLGVVF